MYKILLILLSVLLIVIGILYGPKIARLYQLANLYNEDSIDRNFINIDKIFSVSEPIPVSDNPYTFPRRDFVLPETFFFDGEQRLLSEELEHYKTDGLIVLHNGNLLYENYWNNNSATSKHIAFSVTKSFVSALVGIALDEGLIDNIEDPITKYLSDFNGTGYEGVRIKDILQMSSGVDFNEDYADPKSDINRFGRATARGSSFRDFAKSLERGREPGTYHHYVSIDTQVLGFLLAEVTGMPLKEYLYKKIWNKIGMEDDAFFIVDNNGVEMALGGLNATLRDYAKFGELYLNRGKWNGEQVVPASWVDASHTTDGPHLKPGESELSSSPWGYGLQWWVPGFPDTDYTASGVYNQYIYIDPLTNVVIAKTSSNHRYTSEKEYSKAAHVAMFRAIAESIK
ncbi:beta-lactamase family protein [Gammaproteobacteria bacterium]|jgi:CubicO group peptidase (beta-lactamase class C family)|nr:beta-lactamase family protein [Gammaproteobacteria bacterium]MDB4848688.1 beta-lactamase family protein [Gammaproteobacteria bacterium]MDC0401271.1 beta-lactamase family protein [Gammaproteobacteria bacterium]MDC3365576.1 beta-lactamase family protein [Gammaproteobacteria bacterium]